MEETMTLTNGSTTHEESDVEKVLIIPDAPELLDSELNKITRGAPSVSEIVVTKETDAASARV